MKPDLSDLFVTAGLALLGYGLWKVHPPAAFIADGAIMLLIGLRGAAR